MTAPEKLPGVIVFQFQGGVRDGQTVRSDQSQDNQNEANRFWALTWEGTVGRRFDVSSLDGPPWQRYQVKSKYEAGGEIHVACEKVSEE